MLNAIEHADLVVAVHHTGVVEIVKNRHGCRGVASLAVAIGEIAEVVDPESEITVSTSGEVYEILLRIAMPSLSPEGGGQE